MWQVAERQGRRQASSPGVPTAGAPAPPGTHPLGLVGILFTNNREGAYCAQGGRNRKEISEQELRSQEAGLKDNRWEGRGVGSSTLERLGGEIQVCLGPVWGCQEREGAESEPLTVELAWHCVYGVCSMYKAPGGNVRGS